MILGLYLIYGCCEMFRSEHDSALPTADIFYDAEFNCRGEFTLQSVKELAESIVEVGGLICPVTVQPWNCQPGFKYRLVVGYRRYRAVTVILKHTTIVANICHGLTEHQAQLLNITENLERKDLNLWEEACALQRLYPKGTTDRIAAKELKRTTNWVRLRWKLLKMPPSIQQKAAAGLLSQANLATLAGLSLPEDQVLLADKIAEARQRGTGKRLPGLDRKYKHRSKYPRGKKEIDAMILRMLDGGIRGLAPRVGAWCAGSLADEELLADIDSETKRDCTMCKEDIKRLTLQTARYRRLREQTPERMLKLVTKKMRRKLRAKLVAELEADLEITLRPRLEAKWKRGMDAKLRGANTRIAHLLMLMKKGGVRGVRGG